MGPDDIAQLPEPDAIGALAEVVRTQDDCFWAVKALAIPRNRARMAALAAVLDDAPSPSAARAALMLVGQSKPLRPFLLACLQRTEAPVRAAAYAKLADAKLDDEVDWLKRGATDSSAKVRSIVALRLSDLVFRKKALRADPDLVPIAVQWLGGSPTERSSAALILRVCKAHEALDDLVRARDATTDAMVQADLEMAIEACQ